MDKQTIINEALNHCTLTINDQLKVLERGMGTTEETQIIRSQVMTMRKLLEGDLTALPDDLKAKLGIAFKEKLGIDAPGKTSLQNSLSAFADPQEARKATREAIELEGWAVVSSRLIESLKQEPVVTRTALETACLEAQVEMLLVMVEGKWSVIIPVGDKTYFHEGHFTGSVSHSELQGYFEHDEYGDNLGGSLLFERLDDGRLSIIDYDGVTSLPGAVSEALVRMGIDVDDDFKPDVPRRTDTDLDL